jgi:PAS domain S-box-containing protein/diguanylate cyclase (GGDEF)-like protein
MSRRLPRKADTGPANLSESTRVLLAEDSDRDVELVLRELRRSGLKFESRRVQTEADFRRALDEFRPQIILSDFAIPGFAGVAALRICREIGIEIPFIFVSGTIGEEAAIEAMKAGADDYVMKTNLIRLGPTVKRALREAGVQRDRRAAEAALQGSEARHRAMFEQAAAGIVHSSLDGRLLTVNPKFAEIIGYTREEAQGLSIKDITHPEDIEGSLDGRARMLTGTGAPYEKELRLVRRDGSRVWAQITTSLVRAAEGQPSYFISIILDISERKRFEESSRRFKLALDNSADMILISDVATMRHVDVNKTASELLGYTREELLRMGPPDILPVSREELARAYEALIANPAQSSGIKSYYLCKDGSHLPFESTRRVLRSENRWILAAVSRDIRERLAAEQELRESEQNYRRLFEANPNPMWIYDPKTLRFVAVNDAAIAHYGYGRDEFLSMTIADIRPPAEAKRLQESAALESREGVKQSGIWKHRKKGGDLIDVEISSHVSDLAGRRVRVVLAHDITERKRAEEGIRRLNRVYAVLSGIDALIVRVSDRDELFREACRIAVEAGKFRAAWIGVVDRAANNIQPVAWQGLDDEYLRAMPILQVAVTEGVAAAKMGLAPLAVMQKKPMITADMTTDPRVILREEAKARDLRSLAIMPLLISGEAVGVLALYAAEVGFFDEEEMKLLRELAGNISFALDHIEKASRLDYLAYYDALTGLANRTLFHERLTQHIHAAENSERKLAVVVADIERFRMINDSLGRQTGDALLKQLAGRFARVVEKTEIARIGADQFAIVLTEMKGRSEIGRTVEDIWHGVLDEPYRLGETEIRIALKGGIALFPGDGKSAETLFRNAEAAWKNAKQKGERYLFHSQEMTARIAERLTLENKLRQAIGKQEFVLHYQPKVDLETRRIVGVEALIRWQSPELGLVPPLKFIPLMEETGMILEMGAWALKRAAADHRGWVEQGLKAPRIAVNVSPIQLRQRDFVAVVEQAIMEGVAPTGIDLEITESLIMDDVQGNIAKLKAVRQLGVQIAIDDFGTGYSSLAYLAKLPVHLLKIDRAFIITMLNDADAMALVQTIISLAHSLRLKVVAEGVDAEEQAKMLHLLRCDQMQGYLFSKPVPMDELSALLHDPK